MKHSKMNYEVFLDSATTPPMYGIRCGNRAAAHRISTDYQEVSRLAQRCNRAGLSDVHLRDVAEDFGRA